MLKSGLSRRNVGATRRETVFSVYGFVLAARHAYADGGLSNSQELDQAKQTIADLEEALKAERARLRDLMVEQTRAEREKENVLLQLRRTESDMEDVKLQMQRVKRNNNVLEDELRGA